MFSKAFLWTGALLILAGVVELQTIPPGFEARKVSLSSYELKIEERDGKCKVTYDGIRKGEFPLDVPPPCEFLRDKDGKAQRWRYKSKSTGGFYDVILVIGGPIDQKRSHELMKDGCATQTQAISVSSTRVIPGAVGSGLTVCPFDRLEEKFFGSLQRPL